MFSVSKNFMPTKSGPVSLYTSSFDHCRDIAHWGAKSPKDYAYFWNTLLQLFVISKLCTVTQKRGRIFTCDFFEKIKFLFFVSDFIFLLIKMIHSIKNILDTSEPLFTAWNVQTKDMMKNFLDPRNSGNPLKTSEIYVHSTLDFK